MSLYFPGFALEIAHSFNGTIRRMTTDCILQTQKLSKEFKGFVAVDRVSLSVRRGSIHALIGPNGAGKTTCFNLLIKFINPPRA